MYSPHLCPTPEESALDVKLPKQVLYTEGFIGILHLQTLSPMRIHVVDQLPGLCSRAARLLRVTQAVSPWWTENVALNRDRPKSAVETGDR